MKKGLLFAALGVAAAGTIVTAASAAGKESAQEGRDAYRLALYGGRVAVYETAGADAPRRVTSIQAALLPTADKKSLREGITVSGEEELARLLEDFGL